MNAAVLWIGILILLFASTAFGQVDTECKKFKISFSSEIKTQLDGVFHGGNQIGTIINSEIDNVNSSHIVKICIDKKYSSEIENNTVCYISENNIIVYNVWASGKDLPENSAMPGFSNKISLFWYEIKLLFQFIIGDTVR